MSTEQKIERIKDDLRVGIHECADTEMQPLQAYSYAEGYRNGLMAALKLLETVFPAEMGTPPGFTRVPVAPAFNSIFNDFFLGGSKT